MRKSDEKLLASFGELKDDPFNFEEIERYFRNNSHSEAFHVLSDKTCNDLDFRELFMLTDRTNSKIGQQYFYQRLRVLRDNPLSVTRFENIIEKFIADPGFRLSVQKQLKRLNRTDAIYISSLFQDEHLQPPGWFFMIRILSFASLLSLILMFFTPQIFFVLLVIFLMNAIIHYWNKRNIYQYLGSIPQLLKMNDAAGVLFKNDLLKVH